MSQTFLFGICVIRNLFLIFFVNWTDEFHKLGVKDTLQQFRKRVE